MSFLNSDEFNQVCDSKHRWQQMRQSTREWYMAARVLSAFKLYYLTWGPMRQGERGALPPTLKSGRVTALLAQWDTLKVGGPHPASHRDWRPIPSATATFEQKKIPTSSSKERTVLWRSNHLHIGVYTLKFWQFHALKEVLISEGSFFMYPASNSHTGCVANNIL